MSTKNKKRQPKATQDRPGKPKSTKAPTVAAPLTLNDHWRVASDGVQWMIERHSPKVGWRPIKFHIERDPMIRTIRREIGAPVGIMEELASWPPFHPTAPRQANIKVAAPSKGRGEDDPSAVPGETKGYRGLSPHMLRVEGRTSCA